MASPRTTVAPLAPSPRGTVAARVRPCLVAGAVAVAVLPLAGEVRWAEAGIAGLLFAALVVLFALVPSVSDDRRPDVAAIVGLLVVAVLRDATGGPGGGYGVLAVLPVLWVALHGRPVQLWRTVAALAVVYALPVIVIGAPRYPSSAWRAAVLVVVLYAVIGMTVQYLLRRERGVIADRTGLLEAIVTSSPPGCSGWRRPPGASIPTAASLRPLRLHPHPGALLDELRGRDWASRSVRAQARGMQAAHEELTNRSAARRRPTRSRRSLDVPTESVHKLVDDVHRATVLNYDSLVVEGDAEAFMAGDEASPEEAILDRERKAYLVDAVAALPERLQRVVVGYFFEERSMQDLADELGVSESRISQLRAEALLLLKDGMNCQLEPDAVSAEARPTGAVARRKAAYYAAVAAWLRRPRSRVGAADRDDPHGRDLEHLNALNSGSRISESDSGRRPNPSTRGVGRRRGGDPCRDMRRECIEKPRDLGGQVTEEKRQCASIRTSWR